MLRKTTNTMLITLQSKTTILILMVLIKQIDKPESQQIISFGSWATNYWRKRHWFSVLSFPTRYCQDCGSMLGVFNFSNKKMMTTVAVCIMKLLPLAHHPVIILSATSLQPAIHVGGSSLVSGACSFLHRKRLLLPAVFFSSPPRCPYFSIWVAF